MMTTLPPNRHSFSRPNVYCTLPCYAVLAVMQAFPNTPWVFVYRDPVPVMMSLLGFKAGMVSDPSAATLLEC